YVAMPMGTTCASETTIPAALVEAPTHLTLADTELATANQLIAVDRTRPISVTWTPTTEGSADVYITALYEVIGTSITQRALIFSTSPIAHLDPSLLVLGHAYAVSVTARIGAPNSGMGDFE